MTICAIHQPNFFPWLGFFDKICRADVFVFLDDVAYPRSGSKSMASMSNRVKMNLGGDAKWVSCPVKKAPLGTKISEVQISNETDWRGRLLRSLEESYHTADNFEAAQAVLEPLIRYEAEGISDFNKNAIMRISETLQLKTHFVSQADLSLDTSSTNLLIDVCRAVGADTYLCGGGAGGYQDDDAFEAAGIELVYQNFRPRPYADLATFVPGLSIMDYLLLVEDWKTTDWGLV
ncbi:MAG: wbmP [Rhodobiaceae bacterium]|nr:wbmP [Rhodobiaceae bacterium]